MEWKLPLLLDGDMTGFLLRKGMPGNGGAQLWLLEHPNLLLEAHAAYVAAGADALCTPTFRLNELRLAGLSEWDGKEPAERINRDFARITVEAAGDMALATGGISATGMLPEPFGLIPYSDMIDTFAEQALALRDGGVKLLLLTGISALAEARAAVLGARQARLPVLASMRMSGGLDPLAALVCLQELGVVAFGFDHIREYTEVAAQIELLAPYAKVPLIAQLDARFGDKEGQLLTEQAYAQAHLPLLLAGARVVGGGVDVTPGHLAALRAILDSMSLAPIQAAQPAPGEPPLLLADVSGVYHLEEDFTVSELIDCRIDMSEAILEAEDGGYNALRIHIASEYDAYLLGQNAHMISTAVCLYAEKEELLEQALILYNGRALIDSRSEIDRDILDALAKGYGAIVR